MRSERSERGRNVVRTHLPDRDSLFRPFRPRTPYTRASVSPPPLPIVERREKYWPYARHRKSVGTVGTTPLRPSNENPLFTCSLGVPTVPTWRLSDEHLGHVGRASSRVALHSDRSDCPSR